jgi:HEPN domain-containing protein
MAEKDMSDDVVGFHAQQAVEKALKVALVMADIDFPRTHDLRELVDIGVDDGVAVPDSIHEARWLTPWAAIARSLSPLQSQDDEIAVNGEGGIRTLERG